jgi:hypothetical protein
VCEITVEDLKRKFEEQNGKCFYSGIELRSNTRAWRASLERRDPSLGYTYDNTVLCCLEFNGKCQWSPHDIHRLVYLVFMNDYGKLQFDLETFDLPTNERKKRILVEHEDDVDGNRLHRCTHCAELKPAIMFVERIDSGCKACRSKKNTDRKATPRGVMRGLVDSARARTKSWQKENDLRGGNGPFELSLDVLIDIYKDQEGRCAYSGLPFDFGTQHRKPSLERKDPLKPYTKDNICLIWMVWNTADHAANIKHGIKPGDHGGWNQEKFEYAFSHILAKVKKEFEDAHEGAPMTMDEFKTQFIKEYKEHDETQKR